MKTSSPHKGRNGTILLASIALAVSSTLSTASAALLLDPATGSVLTFTTDLNDDAKILGSRGLNGDFFGFDVTGVIPTINLDGYISLGGPEPRMNPLLLGDAGTSADMIAPLWLEYGVSNNTQIIEHSTSSYYGITWQNLTVPGLDGELVSFQAIFIEGATTLHGQSLFAGDVVFSYGDLSFYQSGSHVVIGMREMFGEYAGLYSSDMPDQDLEGWHSFPATGAIPVSANEFVLFRPDGAGNYSVSVEAIPEPSVSLLMASGVFLICKRRRR